MKRAIQLSLVLSAVLLGSILPGSPALAAEPRWQPVGPFGHDGLLLFPTGDPEILYVTTFYTGLHRSDDGGQSWSRIHPFFSGVLSVDPRDPDKLVGAPNAQGPALRSVDGGRTFTPVADGYLYQGIYPAALSLQRDPEDPDVVFAATDSGLFRFDGERWELIAFAGSAVTAFAIDPLAPEVWHAATTDSAQQRPVDTLISRDAGATWSRAPGEISRVQFSTILFDPARPHRAYALANCRPAVFTDGAWRPLPAPAGLTCTMTVTEEGRLIAPFFRADRQGLLVSDDGGVTWTVLRGPIDILFRVASIAGDDEVLVASGGRGLWRSVDGGLTWRASSEGISGFIVGDIAVAADGTVFASPGAEGVYRSRDAGRSWQRMSRGLNADARGTPTLAVDPRNAAVVWAGGSGLNRSRDAGRTWQGLGLPGGAVEGRIIVQILIDPTREGVVYVRTYAPVAPGILGPFIYRTLDDGRTWQRLPALFRDAGGLAVAPSDGTLYAWTGNGVFVSRDAGSSWRRVRRSMPERIRTWAVDPEQSGVVWLGGEEGGVWRSTDGGRSFVPLTKGDFLLGPAGDFAFDPADPEHPYVSIQGQGVYQWRRAGWQKVGTEDAYLQGTYNGPLAFDAERGILYAGTSTRGIYRLRLR